MRVVSRIVRGWSIATSGRPRRRAARDRRVAASVHSTTKPSTGRVAAGCGSVGVVGASSTPVASSFSVLTNPSRITRIAGSAKANPAGTASSRPTTPTRPVARPRATGSGPA